MAMYDFSTVDAYSDEQRIELYIPYTQKDLGTFVKSKFNARFKTDGNKKRWVIELKFAKASEETIITAVEEELYEMAFPGWRKIVKMFSNYACCSTRYEVKFSAGGLRIKLPGGHPLHYYLEKMCGIKPSLDIWKIPASLIDTKEIAGMLKRISEEDREVFTDATEPYEGRRIIGKLHIPFSEAKSFNLDRNRIVFADYSFLKVADPQVVSMPIHAWPLKVISLEPREDGIKTTFDYMKSEAGSRAVGKLSALPDDRRPRLIDEIHASEKWKSRSPY